MRFHFRIAAREHISCVIWLETSRGAGNRVSQFSEENMSLLWVTSGLSGLLRYGISNFLDGKRLSLCPTWDIPEIKEAGLLDQVRGGVSRKRTFACEDRPSEGLTESWSETLSGDAMWGDCVSGALLSCSSSRRWLEDFPQSFWDIRKEIGRRTVWSATCVAESWDLLFYILGLQAVWSPVVDLAQWSSNRSEFHNEPLKCSESCECECGTSFSNVIFEILKVVMVI